MIMHWIVGGLGALLVLASGGLYTILFQIDHLGRYDDTIE
jgi:hypothetical protein